MLERIRNNPVMTTSFIKNGLALAVGFGLKITAGQLALLLAFVNSGLDLFVWTQVEPMVKRLSRDREFLNEVVRRQDIAISDQTQKAKTRVERAQGRSPKGMKSR